MKKMLTVVMISTMGMLLLVFNVQHVAGLDPPSTEWSQTYGGTSYDLVYWGLVQTRDGGYALAGTTCLTYGAGDHDFWLVKTDANGYEQWNKTYGGTGWEEAYALVQTGDGGYAIVGVTSSYGAGNYDCWLVKTDANGNEQWNMTYGGANWEEAHDIVQTSDGGYALAGVTSPFFGAGDHDFWLVKTDASGNMQWNKTYGGIGWDEARALVLTSDGGYTIGGRTESFGAGGRDFWLVRTDAVGNEQWNITYGGTSNDDGLDLVQTSDGGYALTGLTLSFGAGSADYWLVRTDADGHIQWNQTYGGTGYDEGRGLVQTRDGGYALIGWTSSSGNGDFWLVKTDSAGNALWNKTYGGASQDEAYVLVQTSDGGYALAGYTGSYGAGNWDIWLLKLARIDQSISWEYVFKDSKRGTILKISTDDRYFQFTAPDKDFGVKHDPNMKVLNHFITICYGDREMRLVATAFEGCVDFCSAVAWDKQTGRCYVLIDKPNWGSWFKQEKHMEFGFFP